MEWLLLVSAFKNVEGLFIDEKEGIASLSKNLSSIDPLRKGTLEMEVRKAGLGFFTSCIVIMSVSKYYNQTLLQNDRAVSNLSSFYKMTGAFLVIDSLFVKFRGFHRSGLFNFANGAGAGVIDLLGGLYFIHHGLAIESGEIANEKLINKEKRIRQIVAGAAMFALITTAFPEQVVRSAINPEHFPDSLGSITNGINNSVNTNALCSEYIRWKCLFDLYLIAFAIFSQRRRAGLIGVNFLVIKAIIDNSIQSRSQHNIYLIVCYLLSIKLQYTPMES